MTMKKVMINSLCFLGVWKKIQMSCFFCIYFFFLHFFLFFCFMDGAYSGRPHVVALPIALPMLLFSARHICDTSFHQWVHVLQPCGEGGSKGRGREGGPEGGSVWVVLALDVYENFLKGRRRSQAVAGGGLPLLIISNQAHCCASPFQCVENFFWA